MSLSSSSEPPMKLRRGFSTVTVNRSGSTSLGSNSPKSHSSVKKTFSRVSSLLFKNDKEQIKKQVKIATSILVRLPEDIMLLVQQIENSKQPLTTEIDKIYKEDYLPEDIETNQTNILCCQLIKSLETQQIYLFDEINNIISVLNHSKEQLLRFARVLCNGMEISHFHLLEVMTKALIPIQQTAFCDAFVSRLVTIDNSAKMLHLKLFFQTITQYFDEIFDKEKFDPYYVDGLPSREIAAASGEAMFDLIFDDNYHESQYMRNFIYFLPYMMKHREVYTTIMKYYNTFIQEHPIGDEMQAFLSWKFVRLERLVLSWLDIMSTMIMEVEPEFFKELCSSPLLESEQLTIIFKNKFKNFLKNYDEKCSEDVEVVPYLQTVAHDILFSFVVEEANDEQQIKILLETFTIEPIYSLDQKSKTVNLIQLQPEFLAEQLILYDSKEFQKIHCHDFYLSRKNTTLDGYVKSCQKVEFWAMKTMNIIGKYKIYEYFIKVAKFCLEKKGYNTCYLLYSTLTRESIQHPDIWMKIKKSKLQTYQKLQVVFDMGNNYRNYRNTCSEEDSVPIMLIWMHDIVNINCIPTKIDEIGLFNFSKLRAIGTIINSLHNSQKVEFDFKPHDTVQRVINNIIVPDLK